MVNSAIKSTEYARQPHVQLGGKEQDVTKKYARTKRNGALSVIRIVLLLAQIVSACQVAVIVLHVQINTMIWHRLWLVLVSVSLIVHIRMMPRIQVMGISANRPQGNVTSTMNHLDLAKPAEPMSTTNTTATIARSNAVELSSKAVL